MPDSSNNQSRGAELREALAEAGRKVRSHRSQLSLLIRSREEARRGLSPRELARSSQEFETKRKELENSIALHLSISENLSREIRANDDLVFVKKTQKEYVDELDGDLPILLFPVRVEAKFVEPPAKGVTSELWVRIFPEPVTIESHEEALTPDELENGKSFWSECWRAGSDLESHLGPWRVLASQHGHARASWIALRTRPKNSDMRPANPIPEGEEFEHEPEFPEAGDNLDLREESWTRSARCRSLPERFIISLIRDDQVVLEVTTKRIPEELRVSPDPTDSESTFGQPRVDFSTDPALGWLFDFDKAVEKGMGVKIPLTGEIDNPNQGFDRLVALGVKVTFDPKESRKQLEELIRDHRYSAGIELLRQGTPTNNTTGEASGFSESGYSDEESLQVELGEVQVDVADDRFSRKDGQRLAEALGIAPKTLAGGRGCNNRGVQDALAINSVLFPATIGYFLEQMLYPKRDPDSGLPLEDIDLSPVISLEAIRRVKLFFEEYVVGRGHLSPIRVGDQPYGILPITSYSRWKWQEEEERFENKIFNILYSHVPAFKGLSASVVHMGRRDRPGADPHADLLQILSQHGRSVQFHQRLATGRQYNFNLGTIILKGQFYEELLGKLDHPATGLLLDELITSAWGPSPFLFDTLTFFEDQEPLGRNLVEEPPPSETKGLEELFAGAGKNYIEWLVEGLLSDIRTQTIRDAENNPVRAPRTLLYLMLKQGLLLQYWDSAMRILEYEEVVQRSDRQEREIVNILGPEKTKWHYLAAKLDEEYGDMEIGEWLQQALANAAAIPNVAEVESAVSELRKSRNGLSALAGRPTAALERALVEHIDLCSYRLDAWLQGFVVQRLEEKRATAAVAEAAEPPGLYLGAFGWLENVRPSEPPARVSQDETPEGVVNNRENPLYYEPDNGGFIHAPSLNHASTAAILRSGHRAHKEIDPSLMSVNLSSQRVRRAWWYMEGIKNGQEFGALLGYRFERGLRDADSSGELAKYILDFRKRFPLGADRPLPGASQTAEEVIEPQNVVDGRELVRAAIETGYPYGISALNNAPERQAIENLVQELLNDSDALKDVTVAEGVHQLVTGNLERAKAVLRMSSEGYHPTDLDVIRTPRNGFALTHRVIVDWKTEDGGQALPWPEVDRLTPRAAMEPQLNRWLGTFFVVNPTLIFLRATWRHRGDQEEPQEMIEDVSLDRLQLQPIDLVYSVSDDPDNDMTGFEQLIRNAVYRVLHNQHGAAVVDREIQIDLQASAGGNSPDAIRLLDLVPLLKHLRHLVSTSRPLGAADFKLPSDLPSEMDNRFGYQWDELKGRLDSTEQDLTNRVEHAHGILQSIHAGGEILAPSAEEYAQLADDLLELQLYGFGGNLSATQDPDTLISKAQLALTRVADSLAELRSSVASASNPETPLESRVELLREAAALLFGGGFNALPVFDIENENEVEQAYERSNALLEALHPAAVEEWLQGVGRVREPIGHLEKAVLLGESLGGSMPVYRVLQIPITEKDVWLGVTSNGDLFNRGDTVSIVTHRPFDNDVAGARAGLVVDDFVETIPADHITTGLGFNVGRPGSQPPQSLLLAVNPVQNETWSWSNLLGAVTETLHWAKMRGVDPDLLADHPAFKYSPAIMMPASRLPVTIATDFAVMNGQYFFQLPFDEEP